MLLAEVNKRPESRIAPTELLGQAALALGPALAALAASAAVHAGLALLLDPLVQGTSPVLLWIARGTRAGCSLLAGALVCWRVAAAQRPGSSR